MLHFHHCLQNDQSERRSCFFVSGDASGKQLSLERKPSLELNHLIGQSTTRWLVFKPSNNGIVENGLNWKWDSTQSQIKLLTWQHQNSSNSLTLHFPMKWTISFRLSLSLSSYFFSLNRMRNNEKKRREEKERWQEMEGCIWTWISYKIKNYPDNTMLATTWIQCIVIHNSLKTSTFFLLFFSHFLLIVKFIQNDSKLINVFVSLDHTYSFSLPLTWW